MRNMARFAFATSLFLYMFLGCSGPDDGKVVVTGSVQIDDKPLVDSLVAFVGGTDGGILGTASTDRNGKFQVRAATGLNRVTVSKLDQAHQSADTRPKTNEEQMAPSDAEIKKLMAKSPKSLIPTKYSSPETSGLQFEIASGMEPLSISLSSRK